MALTSDPSALTAALFHLACAAAAAAVLCSSLVVFLAILATRKFRGAVNDAEGVLRSKIEDH